MLHMSDQVVNGMVKLLDSRHSAMQSTTDHQ